MNRRSFISSLLAGTIAPAFLPGAGRVWKRNVDSGLVEPIDDGFVYIGSVRFHLSHADNYCRNLQVATLDLFLPDSHNPHRQVI